MKNSFKFEKHIVTKRIFFIIILVIIFYIIFNFSAQNGETSGKISLKVTKFIVDHFLSIFKEFDNITRWQYINTLHPIIRKLAHFTIYSAVGFSAMGFWCTFDIKNKFKILWSALIGISYAGSDEFHQSFIIGRGASITDVGIDSAGVITGICIIILFILISKSFQKRKNKLEK